MFERSRQLCCGLYQKPPFSEGAYLAAAGRWGVALPPAGMAVFAALFAWRDATARALDESPGYVLPRAALVELSRGAPDDAAGVRRLLGRGSGLDGSASLAVARADEVVAVIRRGKQQAAGGGDAAAPGAAAAAPAGAAAAIDGGGGASGGASLKPRELPALQPGKLSALAARPHAGAAAAAAAGSGLRPPGLRHARSERMAPPPDPRTHRRQHEVKQQR